MMREYDPVVTRRIGFPRPFRKFKGVPFHGLFGWNFGDPEVHVARADVVIAIDVMTRVAILVSGQVRLFHCEFGGATRRLRVLTVELDFDSDEIDTLAVLVEFVKGEHDLPWEIDV